MNKQTKILLVDDEPNILLAIDFLLKKEGYTTKKAFNGQQAIDEVVAFRPDIVVLDVMMPEYDGFEVARRIRNMPDFEDVRIIFLTAKGTETDKMRGYTSGGEVYLIKPFDNDELVQVINEVVSYG
ncbi:MAG: response regulator [Saprospiraceae bacterium]|nr:response regulator [Saprospiraceae bacterium]